MNEFMKASKGAISILLIIVLLPMMTMAGVFIDLARTKLAQEVVVSSADLAINTVLTDYDKDLKEYFGLIASSQDTKEVISVSKKYFADSLISAGFTTSEAEAFVDDVVSAFAGDDDIQDMLQLSVEGEADITRTANGALNNTALLKEGISEFMKYRSPVNGVAMLFEKIREADIAGQLEDASAETKMVEAREAFLKAEKKLIKKAEEAYKSIKKYNEATAHTGDKYTSEEFLNKFSEFLINPLEHSNIPNGNQLANTIGKDWETIYKDAHIKMTMNLYNTHNTSGDLSISLIKYKGLTNPGASTTFSDSNKADAKDLKDLITAFNTAVSNYYSKRASLNSAWNNTGGMASGDWPIQYWVKLTNNCETKRDQYVTAANKVWDLGNELYNALSYLEEDVFKNQQIKRPNNNYVAMPPADSAGMVSLEAVKDALWNDYNANIYPDLSAGGCSSLRNVNSQASTLNNNNQNHERLKHGTVTHIYDIGSELQRFVNDAEEAAKLLKDAKEDVEALKDLMKDYKKKFDAWKTAAYDSSLDNSTMATGDNGDRKLIDEYEERGMINISDASVDELAKRIGNTQSLFETLAKDMKGIKYNGTSVVNVINYNKFRSASKLDASKIPVNEQALRNYANETFSFSIGKQIQRIEIWGGRTSDSFDGGEYYYITDSFHPILTKPTTPPLYDWLEYKFGTPTSGTPLDKDKYGFSVSDESSAEDADGQINGKGETITGKVDTGESTKGKSFSEWNGATLPSKGKNAPEEKKISDKLSDASKYVSDLFSDFSGTFGASLENTRDDLFAEDYIFSMFTHDTFEKEGYYSKLPEATQKEVTALNADSKYADVKDAWTGSDEVKTLTLHPRNAQNNWCYGGEIEYILYGNSSNTLNKGSAYANVFMIRYALDLKPIFDIYWEDKLIDAVAKALEMFAYIPATLTKTLICLAITIAEASADLAYLKQGIPVLIYKSETKDVFCNYKSVFTGGDERSASRDGICLQYSDYLKMFLFMKFKSDENQVYLRTGDVIQANVSHATSDFKFELAKSQVFYTLHADVIMEPMWSRLLAIDDLGDLSTGRGWRTISITTTGGY